jgi:uncharacterized lipoprotein YmbA
MKTLLNFNWLAAVLLGATLSGCMNLKPTADPTRFFVLSVVPAKESLPEAGKLAWLVSVATLETPAYLDNNCLAIRRNEAQLDYAQFLQWAEPVRAGITRCLREDLASLLGAGRVNPLSYRRPSGDCLEVQANISRFEFTGSGQAVLAVRWLIVQGRTGVVLRAQSSEFTRENASVTDNPDTAVRALSEAISLWSREVAEALITLAGNKENPGI